MGEYDLGRWGSGWGRGYCWGRGDVDLKQEKKKLENQQRVRKVDS